MNFFVIFFQVSQQILPNLISKNLCCQTSLFISSRYLEIFFLFRIFAIFIIDKSTIFGNHPWYATHIKGGALSLNQETRSSDAL